jgi:prevent-host-death family protein
MEHMASRTGLNLDVDLQRGVVPISKAASSLAALIKRAHANGQPVIVTQKGYPTGVLLPIELFTALKALADGEEVVLSPLAELAAEGSDSLDDDVVGQAPAAPARQRPATRRRKAATAEAVG